jgi:hypothetical protein
MLLLSEGISFIVGGRIILHGMTTTVAILRITVVSLVCHSVDDVNNQLVVHELTARSEKNNALDITLL